MIVCSRYAAPPCVVALRFTLPCGAAAFYVGLRSDVISLAILPSCRTVFLSLILPFPPRLSVSLTFLSQRRCTCLLLAGFNRRGPLPCCAPPAVPFSCPCCTFFFMPVLHLFYAGAIPFLGPCGTFLRLPVLYLFHARVVPF